MAPSSLNKKPMASRWLTDPGQLAHDDAQVLGPFRHLLAHHLFHRHHVAKVVVHGRDIVQAVGVGDVAGPQVPLADLFVVAVQVADDRVDTGHRLALQAHDHAEYAVGAGVLGADVEQDPVGFQAVDVDLV